MVLENKSLPWLSAGPLPPRRKNKSRKSGPAQSAVAHESQATPAQHTESDLKLPSISTEAVGSPKTAVISPNSIAPSQKVPPKSWSDLLKPKNAEALNGLTNGHMRNGTVPYSFTNLADLLSRYDPQSHSISPLIQPRGLINKGNMCFMNAILQVLVYCPPFYNLFDRVGKEVRQRISSRTPLMDAMVMFIREFQLLTVIAERTGHIGDKAKQMALEDIGEAFGPDNIYSSMRGNSRFNSMQRGRQEDAEEFLGFLLDGLHEEFLQSLKEPNGDRTTTVNVDAPVATEDNEERQEWLEIGKKQKVAVTRTATTIDSPISRIFGGTMRSVLRIAGARDSVTLEPFQPLQLDIQSPEVSNIADALLQLPVPEVLSGDWTNGSGLKVRATKQVFFETLPPVLILHLKRFHYDNVGGTQKSWKQIGYPLELDVPQEALSPGRRGAMATKYRLIGVVYHHGLSASGGHYTVDVLRQDSKSWIHLDDTSIESVDAKDVAIESASGDSITSKRPDKLAYILLYARAPSGGEMS